MKKKGIVILSFIVIILLILGASYAWFNYSSETAAQRLVTGDIYLRLNNGNDYIDLENIYPITKEEARARNDNYITFSINGKNTSTKNVYYEIFLNYGNSLESPYERFNDKDLVFDLVEIGNNNEETYLLDAVSYDTINNRKIWIDTILHGTTSEEEKTYKLRMWLSDRVIVSDTDVNANYNSSTFKNHYASIKIGVEGDLNEKSLPSSAITRDSYVENGKSYFLTNLSNDYLLEEEGELLDENDEVILEITNPENKLYFSYVDSRGNESTTNNESLRLTYIYNRNETVNIKVFTESKNDSNVKTILHFKVTKNGNVVQEYNKEIDVIGNNYCLNNGFTNLHDCILVSENLSDNINSAKAFINSKGSPDVNITAPTYTYVEEQIENQEYVGHQLFDKWYFASKYLLDLSLGTFTLKKDDGTTNETTQVNLSNDAIGKYTCGPINIGSSSCGTIYKVTSVDVENNKIIATKISSKVAGSLNSEQGLYRVPDNYGDSYIFRGDITNNNVYFGNYYWKVLRINGDGSIRLIFNGPSTSLNGNDTSISITNESGYGNIYPFNNSYGGPTYVGYMYNENSTYWESEQTTCTFITENRLYYFADDFEEITDPYGNRSFKLKKDNYYFSSKVKDLTQEQIDAGLYTCLGDRTSDNCTRLIKVVNVLHATSINAKYITYSPNTSDLANVNANNYSSTAKTQLETWYQNKFMNNYNNGKNVTDYIVDGTWCNDRSITRTGNLNSGYLLTQHTYFAPRTRLIDTALPNRNSTLLCSNVNDRFSMTSEYGNAKLNYPVGLITADEVALAGGKFNANNEKYWLRTNTNFWTMTPHQYFSSYGAAYNISVNDKGAIHTSSSIIYSSRGLRPVINLKSDTRISNGDGTSTNPYIID